MRNMTHKTRMGEYFFKGTFEEQWFFDIKNYSKNKIEQKH